MRNRRPILPQHHEPGFSEPGGRTAMCTLTIIYHEDYEPDIIAVIRRHMHVPRYTKISGVVGARQDIVAETDYESMPNDNRHMLVALAERETVYAVLEDLRELRKKKGHGLRGYVTPAEEVI
jgi:hypothetical protein